MIETHPFGSFIPKNIKYLLLGSFTANSINSDPEYDWFYCSKRNQFWRIIESVYNVELKDRRSKQELFEKLGIGIADIIYQCERSQGNSLDSNLVNIVYNPDLENILREGRVQRIFFSSRFVENQFRKVFKKLIPELSDIELITLPSPSPRYARLTKEQKIERYKEILPKFINPS